MRRGILLTRPIAQSQPMINPLNELGFDPVVCAPVLHIEPRHLGPLKSGAKIIITSQNALIALQDAPRDLMLLVVGTTTFARAQEMGFHQVRLGGTCVKDLRAFLTAHGGDWIYASGHKVTDELHDLVAERRVVYEAHPVERWDEKTIAPLHPVESLCIPVFSKESAYHTLNLLHQHGLAHWVKEARWVAWSSGIASFLQCHAPLVHTLETPHISSFWTYSQALIN